MKDSYNLTLLFRNHKTIIKNLPQIPFKLKKDKIIPFVIFYFVVSCREKKHIHIYL